MKILLFSDPHYSVDSKIEEEKWFPPICKWLEKIRSKFKLKTDLVGKFLSFWDKLTQEKTELLFKTAINFGPYDFVISLGDYTPGVNERGMITDKSVQQYNAFRKLFHKYFLLVKSLFVWGDHDVGYKFLVSGKTGIKIGSEAGGVSIESVMSAQKLIGRPYGSFLMGGVRFIYLSTNLIRNVDDNSPKELKIIAASQSVYIAHKLSQEKDSLKFLLLHDPTALKLDEQIMNALNKSSNTIILHGHMHAEFSAFLTRFFYSFYRNLCKKFRVQVVPAPWGMFGIGKGFLILDLHGDGSYKIKKYKI